MQAWNFAGAIPEDIGTGYDLLLACNSLHASASIAEALTHAFDVLAPGGFLCIYEATCALPALLWGLARQCWAAADERDFALWITLPRWEALLEAAGFQKVELIPWPTAREVRQESSRTARVMADCKSQRLVYSLSEALAVRMQGLTAQSPASPLLCVWDVLSRNMSAPLSLLYHPCVHYVYRPAVLSPATCLR